MRNRKRNRTSTGGCTFPNLCPAVNSELPWRAWIAQNPQQFQSVSSHISWGFHTSQHKLHTFSQRPKARCQREKSLIRDNNDQLKHFQSAWTDSEGLFCLQTNPNSLLHRKHQPLSLQSKEAPCSVTLMGSTQLQNSSRDPSREA